MDNTILSSLNWMMGSKDMTRVNSDISIRMREKSEKRINPCLCITFRAGLSELVFPNGRGTFANFANLIFFKDMTEGGYKLNICGGNSKNPDSKVLSATLNPEQYEVYKDFVGDYELKHDASGYYYIIREGK